jgi:hypothetical protein
MFFEHRTYFIGVSLLPKKQHIHIVTDDRHKELLMKLGKKYGSMTKAFESAIENIEKAENVGSCENCEIKFESEQAEKFQNALNTITLTSENVKELVKYLRGESTVTELLKGSRESAFNFVKRYIHFLHVKNENTYENLLATIEEYKRRTRLFKKIQVDSFTKKIIARVNILDDLPIVVMTGLVGFLEALGFTFDIDLDRNTIILTWIHPEKYLSEKKRIESKIESYIIDAQKIIKPYLFRQGFLPATAGFIDWVAATIISHEPVPMDVCLNTYKSLFQNKKFPKTAQEMGNIVIDSLKFLNYADEFKLRVKEKKNQFRISFHTKGPNIPKLLIQEMIIMLAKWGWKLMNYRIDHKLLETSFYYVGADDPDIFRPYYIYNFTAFLNQRFQKLRMIPVDEYDDLTKFLYELDVDKFREVFNRQGRKFANAIKILADNDLLKMREIGLKVIPQLVRQTQRTSQGTSFLSENNKFMIIFKETNIIEIESIRAIFVAVMEVFGYLNIDSRIQENILTIEFERPQKIEAPPVMIE